ncbi:metal ABC transporter permease [uncultured Helicobacter sp.]|uniref:metal ABC transporter permease n=1 Tax=uncultured Helicobacter sp. TaxID=175537 RepID=UPI0025F624E6|nr:metal ABC transporter permease [uncultured Helicobacter sp.]
MAEIFSYQFVWVALFMSFLVSICSGIIGSIIVANKNVFVAGGVAHSAFGGVGAALFFGFSTTFGALLFGVIMALFLSYAFLYQKERLDAYVGASWAFGMAIGVIFIDITPGYNSDISSYLFGSLLAVGLEEMIAMGIFDVFLVLFVALYYYEMLALFYDNQFCTLKGLNVYAWTSIIFVLIAIGVVLSMSVGGLILILAILSIPAYIAHLFSHSLAFMMCISWLISLISIWVGFFVAYWCNVSIGACIVVLLAFAMFGAIIFHKFIRRIL